MNKDMLHILVYTIWIEIYQKQNKNLTFNEIWHHRNGKYFDFWNKYGFRYDMKHNNGLNKYIETLDSYTLKQLCVDLRNEYKKLP